MLRRNWTREGRREYEWCGSKARGYMTRARHFIVRDADLNTAHTVGSLRAHLHSAVCFILDLDILLLKFARSGFQRRMANPASPKAKSQSVVGSGTVETRTLSIY